MIGTITAVAVATATKKLADSADAENADDSDADSDSNTTNLDINRSVHTDGRSVEDLNDSPTVVPDGGDDEIPVETPDDDEDSNSSGRPQCGVCGQFVSTEDYDDWSLALYEHVQDEHPELAFLKDTVSCKRPDGGDGEVKFTSNGDDYYAAAELPDGSRELVAPHEHEDYPSERLPLSFPKNDDGEKAEGVINMMKHRLNVVFNRDDPLGFEWMRIHAGVKANFYEEESAFRYMFWKTNYMLSRYGEMNVELVEYAYNEAKRFVTEGSNALTAAAKIGVAGVLLSKVTLMPLKWASSALGLSIPQSVASLASSLPLVDFAFEAGASNGMASTSAALGIGSAGLGISAGIGGLPSSLKTALGLSAGLGSLSLSTLAVPVAGGVAIGLAASAMNRDDDESLTTAVKETAKDAYSAVKDKVSSAVSKVKDFFGFGSSSTEETEDSDDMESEETVAA